MNVYEAHISDGSAGVWKVASAANAAVAIERLVKRAERENKIGIKTGDLTIKVRLLRKDMDIHQFNINSAVGEPTLRLLWQMGKLEGSMLCEFYKTIPGRELK